MSEYQYYEFCNIHSPLTAEARKEMHVLSSRAKVSTHGASFVYNYGDFRGDPKEFLIKYFDVFFYISNWGSLQLMFKYPAQQINENELKKYCIEHIIDYETRNQHLLLDINFINEDGLGWIDGEDMLPELLPLYEEIKSGNYQFLQLVAAASNEDTENIGHILVGASNLALSPAQEAFFNYANIDYANIDPQIFYE